jgi:transglycosylase-like protein
MVVVVPRAAEANQIADLTAQATVISQELVLDQLQTDSYRQQYSVASERLAADGRALAQIAEQIGQDEHQIKTETSIVRQLALRSYMNGGGGASGADVVLFIGNEETAQVANEYGAIAAGNIESALNQLDADQRSLQAHQTALQQEQFVDQGHRAQQAAYLVQATSTKQQMESLQKKVTGQLASAVAAQAGAQADTATAAVAGAQRATATPSAYPSGPDPVLNPYLQCVVIAESRGDYGAVSPNGLYMGAFQFSQPTWDMATRVAGRPYLVGLHPNLASKADQDTVAIALYALDGEQPWIGDRCRL